MTIATEIIKCPKCGQEWAAEKPERCDNLECDGAVGEELIDEVDEETLMKEAFSDSNPWPPGAPVYK